MEELLKILMNKHETISTMESCTGGAIASAITDIVDASKVFSFSAVTYSNAFKEKMGVPKEIIDKYSVYSMETASVMAKTIALYAHSSYGVGVTGKLQKPDENNNFGEDDVVYLSIYHQENDAYYNEKIKLTKNTRKECKEEIIHHFVDKMLEILKK